MKEKQLSLAGAQVSIRLGERQASRITRSWPYRHVLGPALRRLEHRNHGRYPQPGPSTDTHPEATPVFAPRPLQMPEETPEQRALIARIESEGPDWWYHTIDLGHGVHTPGNFDHSPALGAFPLPESLAGKRCLDV